MTFIRDWKSRSRWFPRIKTDSGEWAYISDDTTPTGLVECNTRAEAIKAAKEARQRYMQSRGGGTV